MTGTAAHLGCLSKSVGMYGGNTLCTKAKRLDQEPRCLASVAIDQAVIQEIDGIRDEFEGITLVVGIGTMIMGKQIVVEGSAHNVLAVTGRSADVHTIPVLNSIGRNGCGGGVFLR